jgi:hypothetical protein
VICPMSSATPSAHRQPPTAHPLTTHPPAAAHLRRWPLAVAGERERVGERGCNFP